MEKENYSQLELFSGQTAASSPKPCLSSRVMIFLKNYERTLLIVMGFLITSVISFSLGVERGKRNMAMKDSVLRLDMAAKKELPPLQVRPLAQAQKLTLAPAPVAVQANKQSMGAFTVQVASYLKRELAQKEAQSLKKKGVSAAVIPKGKYFILCAGNFSDRRSAEMLLTRLRKQYRDCRIRTM